MQSRGEWITDLRSIWRLWTQRVERFGKASPPVPKACGSDGEELLQASCEPAPRPRLKTENSPLRSLPQRTFAGSELQARVSSPRRAPALSTLRAVGGGRGAHLSPDLWKSDSYLQHRARSRWISDLEKSAHRKALRRPQSAAGRDRRIKGR